MIPFAQWMEQALYGPEGYYSAGVAQTGRAGDYFTAPETGEAFGQLLVQIFSDWGKRLGADPIHLIEVGAGEGRLMQIIESHMILRSGAPAGAPYKSIVIERGVMRRNKMSDLQLSARTYSELSKIKKPIDGVIFANELIDAFPVHRVRMKNGKFEEGFVGGAGWRPYPDNSKDGQGRQPAPPTIEWSSPSTPHLAAYFDRLKIALPEGYETEVNLAMGDWLREASTLLHRGLMVLIDYGRPAWDYYAEERSGGTLRCFKNHRVTGIQDWTPDSDITADVDFTSLALEAHDAGLTPLAFMEMGTFLKMGVGISDPAMAGRSRPAPTDVRYLLHPDGLGTQFHVLILGKNIDPKEWIFDHNRIARLGLSI